MAVRRPYAREALRHAAVSGVILAITAAVLVAQGRVAAPGAPAVVPSQGPTIHYRDAGRGAPVIVLPPSDSRMDAAALESFMKNAGIARASLVGSSAWTSVAAAFAVRHPEMVDKLVLVDGTHVDRIVRDLLRSGS